MIVGVVRESFPGERRVALVPLALPPLGKRGFEVVVERGAGLGAGFADADFVAKGARLAGSRAEVFGSADVLVQVRCGGANPDAGREDLAALRPGQVLVGMADPLARPDLVREMARSGAEVHALELIPRTTRAQSMDVLSSMATVAGYRAALWAAQHLPRFFPMLMTAAGTVTPARVLVVGAGVAGLQAIATARRLGAVVSAYDVRPAVREEVESLGARFVDLGLDAAQGEGGYARAMDEDYYRRQRERMTAVVAGHDVVITTAAVPGKRAPVLVTEAMVEGMPQGGVLVDLAAERGGNCELTRPDEVVVAHGVTILGPTNVPSTLPTHASQMFARNVTAFLVNMLTEEGRFDPRREDDILRATRLTQDGRVVHEEVRRLLGDPAGSAGAEAPGEGG